MSDSDGSFIWFAPPAALRCWPSRKGASATLPLNYESMVRPLHFVRNQCDEFLRPPNLGRGDGTRPQSMGSERFGHGLVEHRLYFVLCGRRSSAGTIGGPVETHPDPEHWSYCLESAHGRLRFCLELLVSFYHAAGSGNGGSDMCACC